MKRSQKIMKTGNSAVVTIPARFLKEIGGKVGDIVLVKTNLEQGKMSCQFSPARQLPLHYEKS
ncbi:hypothetical protein COT63_02130 [Candidatus Shapirobacteria bacterium CG09_land_8_20_14_0_10_38_17]|uniref:SpoVT-AbrB domain-containing protein n=1 Tax=Candidatus Shapirobacteria bacterium CG09_land_8_20_14_0_10_38_17 TaxID=1974884 RepID=A0A2H0WQS1_9BACT|nr:MAG: hypothetical protein COT63_02130 [Candidatus Shapirobacteria bacterium CG09_land_8_20_14_0_10_38_17]